MNEKKRGQAIQDNGQLVSLSINLFLKKAYIGDRIKFIHLFILVTLGVLR